MMRLALVGLAVPVAALAVSRSRQDVWTQEELERVGAEVRAEVEELRGQNFLSPVAMKIADRETFIAHAKKRMDMLVPPEQVQGNELMAKMLGLVPADMDLLAKTFEVLEDQVGGFYVPEEDTFYIMDRFVGPAAKVILAHELTHALDDQLYDIDDDMRERVAESDAGTAYSAVVEGSGTLAMNAYTLRHRDEIMRDAAAMQALVSMSMDSMEDAPAFLWLPLMSAYMRGSTFLIRSQNLLEAQMRDASKEDLQRAFTTPPLSMEQVLHPEKYWDAEQRDDPVEVRFDTTSLPSGWRVVYEDTLGELLLGLVCSPPAAGATNLAALMNPRYTHAAVEGWGGDRLVIAGDADGNARFLRLATVWDTERDAAEFYGALMGLAPTLESHVDALAKHLDERRPDVEIAYGTRPDEVVLTVSLGVRSSRRDDLDAALAYTVTGR